MLELQPITYKEACTFIAKYHRHHLPPQGWKFGLAVNDTVSMGELERQLLTAWTADTSNSSEWSDNNPALGQCAVTALVVQDVFGGDLMRCLVNGNSHYFNLVSGIEYDLTFSQFADGYNKDDITVAMSDYVLSFPETRARYERLRGRITPRTVVGVVTVGRPVARGLDNGWTLEVTRNCTNGTPHVASKLYAAAWRATRALGYKRLVTYTLDSETGTSLKAAGWKVIGHTAGGSWDCPSRPRVDKAPTCQKTLWEAQEEKQDA